MVSHGESSSPSSTCSSVPRALYTLWPRQPITYNETALSHLYGRSQVRTCNFVSIPLPSSDDEAEASDSSAEVEADSPCSNHDKSLTIRPTARLTPMTGGGVTSEILNTELHPQASGRVTNAPVPRLFTNAQKQSHQQGTLSTPEAPLNKPSKAKTKGIPMTNEDSKEGATDEAPHPNVEA